MKIFADYRVACKGNIINSYSINSWRIQGRETRWLWNYLGSFEEFCCGLTLQNSSEPCISFCSVNPFIDLLYFLTFPVGILSEKDGNWILKFIYSEKATNFCEISTVDLSYVLTNGQIYSLTYSWKDKNSKFHSIRPNSVLEF